MGEIPLEFSRNYLTTRSQAKLGSYRGVGHSTNHCTKITNPRILKNEESDIYESPKNPQIRVDSLENPRILQPIFTNPARLRQDSLFYESLYKCKRSVPPLGSYLMKVTQMDFIPYAGKISYQRTSNLSVSWIGWIFRLDCILDLISESQHAYIKGVVTDIYAVVKEAAQFVILVEHYHECFYKCF